jgi:hypothetical protein
MLRDKFKGGYMTDQLSKREQGIMKIFRHFHGATITAVQIMDIGIRRGYLSPSDQDGEKIEKVIVESLITKGYVHKEIVEDLYTISLTKKGKDYLTNHFT